MRCLPLGRLTPLLIAGLLLGADPSAGRSQPPKGQKVLIESFDKVELQGTWYPSNVEGTKSPCVLLVHKIGGNRLQEGWEVLAQGLQEKGFAVLSFDFRGHGDSRNVKPDFWNVRHNLVGMKGANPKRESIDWKDFAPTYYPMLVNDIAAAKVTIEQKNNARECNANDVYVVAAEDGAGLALMWMTMEWFRYKRFFNPQIMAIDKSKEPEGRDLAGIACLSIRDKLGPGTQPKLPISAIFNNPKVPKMRELPICFFYGKKDTFSTYLYDKVLNVPRTKSLKLTFNIAVDADLAGHELLGKKGLGTEELVVRWLSEKVREARPARVWLERDVPGGEKPSLNPLVQVPLSYLGVTVP